MKVKIRIVNAEVELEFGAKVTDKSEELQSEQAAKAECSPAERKLQQLATWLNSYDGVGTKSLEL